MSHPDDDALAALALGDGSPEDARHAEACARCRAELDAYAAVSSRVGSARRAQPLLTPRERVWEAIAAELAADQASGPAHEPFESSRLRAVPAATGESEPSERSVPPASAGKPDELERRRRRAPLWATAAAAVGGVILGVGAVLGFLALGADDAPGEVIAEAPLSDLATEAAAGSAVLESRDDGTEVLVVDTDFSQLEDAYLEVWLIDESIEGMVSLGHLTGERTEFVLPPGFDPEAFPIVDISVEPLDGVPTHSGESVTRGVLGA